MSRVVEPLGGISANVVEAWTGAPRINIQSVTAKIRTNPHAIMLAADTGLDAEQSLLTCLGEMLEHHGTCIFDQAQLITATAGGQLVR